MTDYLGGPDLAPPTPQRSERLGFAGALLDTREVWLPISSLAPQRGMR